MAMDTSWIGGAAQATTGLIGSILQFFGNRETNNTNQNIANQNLGFQRENLDYEKALQQQIFAREDTAYQRTVNDMRAAGLNPLSMQGTNGAGEAIATEPMHNDYQAQNVLNGVFDVFNQYMNMINNNSIASAQSNLINEQAKNQKIKNIYESDLLNQALEGAKKDNLGKDFQNKINNIKWLNDWRDYNFNEQFGLSNNMPDIMKFINIATHQGDSNNSFLGGHVDYYSPNKSFDFKTIGSLLNNSPDFKGAIMENALGKILLGLIGIK